jgi:hypothetical protein
MSRPKKQPEQVHVVREWESSPIIYGWDSRERQENPAYHPPIRLTNKGLFVDEQGRQLDIKTVPAYIIAEAKKTDLNIEYVPPKPRSLSMAEAMLGAGVQDTDPDPRERAARASAAKRAREAYA